MTTRARSATPPPTSPCDDRRNDEARQHRGETHEADDDAPGDRLRVIAQLELARAGGDRNGQQRVVAAEHLSGAPIDVDAPIEIPVFGDQDVARVTRWWLERDRHASSVPVGHFRMRCRQGW